MVFRGLGAHKTHAKPSVDMHIGEERALVSVLISKDSVTFSDSRLALFLVCHI